MDRVAPLLRARRAALDWVVPLTILAIGLVNVSGHPHSVSYPGQPARHVAFLAVAVALLGVRRRAPLLVPILVMAVVTAWTFLWPAGTQGPFEGFVLLVGAAYCLGCVRDRRRLVIGGAVIVAWFAGGLLIGLVGGRAGDVAPTAVWLVAGFGIGYLISRRTDQAHQAWEANRVLATQQEQQTQRAIEDERARIARELHDVVAHSLSVMVVQAAAERRTLHGPATDLDSVDTVLSSIERTGREALVDLRRLLGLLRRTEDPMTLAPQPGLGQLDELVASVRDAGLGVEVDVSGDPPPLPAGLDLTAYRIVQEALTNVLKHADATCVRVHVTYQRNQLDLEVSDDGNPAGPTGLAPADAGHGLIGMRERVTVFGGTVSAGASGTGWTVHARLPLATASVA